MLVHLTPWKKTKTSIRIEQSKLVKNNHENGKKDCRQHAANGEDKHGQYVASFVEASSRQPNRKKRGLRNQTSAEEVPLITITTPNRISIVARSKRLEYSESSSMQYSSRPGETTSFFPSKKVNGHKFAPLPSIPALLDSKRQRLFAMQNGNTRICSWETLGSAGPDEISTLKVDLDQPALSLSLLSSGVLYGSCINGNIFVLRLVHDPHLEKEVLSLEYLPCDQPQVRKMQYVTTLANSRSGNAELPGQKRKAHDSTEDDPMSITFYQIYHTERGLHSIQTEVTLSRMKDSQDTIIRKVRPSFAASTGLPIRHEKGESCSITHASVSMLSSDTSMTAMVFYRTTDTVKNGKLVSQYVWLSLKTASVIGPVVSLPETAKQALLVTQQLAVVPMGEDIAIFDVKFGAQVIIERLQDIIGPGLGRSCNVCTDERTSTLSIFYLDEDSLHVASSVISIGNQGAHTVSPANLKLDSQLISNVFSEGQYTHPVLFSPHRSFLSAMGKARPEESSYLNLSLQIAIDEISSTRDSILSGQTSADGPNALLKAYERALGILSHSAVLGSKIRPQNPQDDNTASKPVKAMNGHAKNGQFGHAKENGVLVSNPEKLVKAATTGPQKISKSSLVCLPSEFVNAAVSIVLSVLCYDTDKLPSNAGRIRDAKPGACVILNRLIETGKVLSRQHFQISDNSGRHFLELTLDNISRCHLSNRDTVSSIRTMHKLFTYCSDVSEEMMVVMIEYALCRASPEETVASLEGMRFDSPHHPFRLIIKKYAMVSQARKSDPKELKSICNKVILAGVSHLLQRIILYSSCNRSMLRVSLLDHLADAKKADVLARVLIELLRNPLTQTFTKRPSRERTGRICFWLSVLCEAFQDEFSLMKTRDGSTRLQSLYRTLRKIVSQSQVIISLHEEVSRLEQHTNDNATPKMGKTDSSFLNSLNLPGYSVERISF